MDNSHLFKDAMRAIALGRPSEDLVEKIPEEDMDEWETYTAAVFAGVIEQTLPEEPGLEAIRDFAEETRSRFEDPDMPFPSLVLEGLIRIMAGEDHLLEQIDPEIQIEVSLLTIHRVAIDDDQVNANLEDYLDKAIARAEEWLAV
ncbi:hypothetical protein [Salininema proteolyticum]|uniref:Uncharacterized protein n=1 Tax=Salininema proteolyticum TaxID=1607685 RepID=A0ABV8TVQ2_9ACTN